MARTNIERFFALKDLPFFKKLHESELSAIALVTKERTFKPSEAFCSKNQVLKKLYLVVEGKIEDEQSQPVPPIIGAASLLYNVPVRKDLKASWDTGAVCLVIQKSHFFTIVYQCPSLLYNLLEIDLIEGTQ